MKLTDEQKLLVENNTGLVVYIVDTYFKRNFFYIDRQELIDEGLYWLCKCTLSYDSSRGVKYSTFVCICIKRHLSEYVTTFYDKRIETVEYEECKDVGYFDTYKIDTSNDMKEFLRKHMNEKYASMAIDYYFNNMNWQEVSEKYGYSNRKAACAVVQKELKKIGSNKHLRNKCYNLFA